MKSSSSAGRHRHGSLFQPGALLMAVLLILVLLSALAGPADAADPGPGDLLVAPTRVVFEGRERNAEITLVNLGATTATYRISLVEMRMDGLGGTTEIAEGGGTPDERFASPMIRFSPRQVRLEPQIAQTVRLSVRTPEGLESGEYRSHLLFRAVPEGVEPLLGESAAAAPAGLDVRLRAVYGVAIPVIVRQGETSASVAIEDLRLLPPPSPGEPPLLGFKLVRTGNRSVYGNLVALYRPRSGKPRPLGEAHGLAVYTPNAERSAFLQLRSAAEAAGAQLDIASLHGEIELSFRTTTGEPLAEAVLTVP